MSSARRASASAAVITGQSGDVPVWYHVVVLIRALSRAGSSLMFPGFLGAVMFPYRGSGWPMEDIGREGPTDRMLTNVNSSEVRRAWPDPRPSPLDDAGLLAAYAFPASKALRVNFATSIDGAVTIAGYSAGLGGPGDKRVFDLLRTICDALMVGAGTLRHEGYGPMRLDERHRDLRRQQGRQIDPTLVVVSHRLALDSGHPMFTEAPVRPIILTNGHSPSERRKALSAVADVLVCGDAEVDLRAAVTALAERGYPQLLNEGGPHLLGALTAADLVDEMCLTVSPKLAGPGSGRITAGPASPTRRLTLTQILTAGDELLLRYARRT